MPFQCDHCQSLFFKTLEIRVNQAGNAVLYKKRCKRCKHKFVLIKTSLQGALQVAEIAEWKQGRKAHATGGGSSPRMIVSEYTARISRATTPPLHYLNRIEAARQTKKVTHSDLTGITSYET